MRVLELFGGIGGLSLGLERAGMETVGFCEIDPTARFWLREHWPGVPIWEDVTKLTGAEIHERVGAIDVVAGGFPCQDLSVAGKGAGLEGARSGLWFELLRIVREVRPRWVCAENVPALRSRGSDTVLAGLEAEGYTCWPLVVGADDVGAPHRRKRVFVVAHRDGDDLREQPGRSSGANGSGAAQSRGRETPGDDADGRGERPVGDADGAGRGEQRRAVPVAAEQPAIERPGVRWPARPGEPQHEWEAPRLADAERSAGRGRARYQGLLGDGTEVGRIEGVGGSERSREASIEDPRPAQSGLGDAAHGLPGRVAGYTPAHRRAALKALGNAVCPQVAEVIGRAIMTVDAAARTCKIEGGGPTYRHPRR